MDKQLEEAKNALDTVIKKSRVHLYKPIQIAEILYRDRVFKDINISDLETYRTKSKMWRDTISIALLGRKCTSSAKFQDDIFNAITPAQIAVLAKENNENAGVVEAYIYKGFANKHSQLSSALDKCLSSTRETFNVKEFIDMFWAEAGLKRSIDKVYEIIVYALFSTLIDTLELKVEISINNEKLDMVKEFEDFTRSVMCLDFSNPTAIQDAKVYRVGVTNAADRGLDMYANWGPAVQIKHLSLDTDLAESIVSEVNSDKIVIVCKTAEKNIIVSLLTQIGWRNKIQSIITEKDLCTWYEKALRGKYGDIYSLQMGIITDLVSFLSNDEASLSKYFENIIANKEKIFTRKFYETLQDDQTGELSERECKNKKSNDKALEECKFLLESSSKYLPILKKTRDKVYCHLDKKSLSIDDCNNEIFCYINDDIVEEIINNISKIISILYALYSNIWKETSYANKNDVRNIIQVIKTYDEYQDKIFEIRSNEIEKEFNIHRG